VPSFERFHAEALENATTGTAGISSPANLMKTAKLSTQRLTTWTMSKASPVLPIFPFRCGVFNRPHKPYKGGIAAKHVSHVGRLRIRVSPGDRCLERYSASSMVVLGHSHRIYWPETFACSQDCMPCCIITPRPGPTAPILAFKNRCNGFVRWVSIPPVRRHIWRTGDHVLPPAAKHNRRK
jgi:hypothetical protein